MTNISEVIFYRTGHVTRAVRTCVCHFAHGNALSPGHVTQDGEDCEAGEETGATVPDDYYQRVP
jgi:hypothetical protein